MHRIPGLESNDSTPAEISEVGAQLSRSEAETLEIVMAGKLEPFQSAADIPGIASIHQVSDAGVGNARAFENRFAFSLPIGLPDILDMKNGDHHAFGIAQSDLAAAGFERFGEGFSDVERNGHRPEEAAGQFHVAANTLVFGLIHEPGQRREAAIEEHFKVADLPRSQIPRREIARFRLRRSGCLAV